MIGLRLLGLLLITCGALVAALCAPCTIIGARSLLDGGGNLQANLLMTAIFAVPMGFGLITIGIGLYLLLARRPQDGDPP